VFVLCAYPVAKKLGFSCAQFVKGLFIRFPKGLGLFMNILCVFLIKDLLQLCTELIKTNNNNNKYNNTYVI
jgi:hypothetical protein